MYNREVPYGYQRPNRPDTIVIGIGIIAIVKRTMVTIPACSRPSDVEDKRKDYKDCG